VKPFRCGADAHLLLSLITRLLPAQTDAWGKLTYPSETNLQVIEGLGKMGRPGIHPDTGQMHYPVNDLAIELGEVASGDIACGR
jgi:hypothetical protein